MRRWTGKFILFLKTVLFLSQFFLVISLFFLRVAVMAVAVRPEMASAWRCGVTVRLVLCFFSVEVAMSKSPLLFRLS